MFIWKDTLKRCNIYAPYTNNFGVKYTIVPKDLYIEIPDPQPPEPPPDLTVDEAFYRTEQDDAPYVVWTEKSADQLKQHKKQKHQSSITSLERETLMNRAVREFLLLTAEAQAIAQGVAPEQLYTVNPAYKSVKDVDTQIAALRAKVK